MIKNLYNLRDPRIRLQNETQFLLLTEEDNSSDGSEPCQVPDSPAVRAPEAGKVYTTAFIGLV